VTVTPNNKYIISGSEDSSIKVFDFHTKQQVHHFQPAPGEKDAPQSVVHHEGILSVAVTSDSRFIISGSGGGSLKVFDLSTKQQVHRLQKAHEGQFIVSTFLNLLAGILSVALTPDNKYIVSASYDKSIKVFDLQTKQLVHHFRNAHEGNDILFQSLINDLAVIPSVAVTPDNRYLVSGSSDGSIKVFDLHTKQQVRHFQNAHESKEGDLLQFQ